MYLGACAKGADSDSNYKKQPYSSIKAKQRAYCLKASYMNSIVSSIFTKEKTESIFDYNQLIQNTFEIAMNSKLNRYFGKSEEELFKQFNINKDSKAKFNLLMVSMLGLRGSINKS